MKKKIVFIYIEFGFILKLVNPAEYVFLEFNDHLVPTIP